MFKNNYRKAFTLIELLIVIGILAILATAVILVINPIELLRQSRDANRITEMNQINQALQLFQSFGGSELGTHNTIYISLPDTDSLCGSYYGQLVATSTGWNYHCSSASTYRNTDGTGWVPVNLILIQSQAGQLFASLPIDPINTVTDNLYYTYIPGSWALSAPMESVKYQSLNASIDGGQSSARFEVGNDLSLNTTFAAAESAVCGNNLQEIGEVCDGADLNSQTCETQLGVGYTGTLSCNVGCSAFVTTACESPATIPGAPTIGIATAGNAQATITFTPPVSDGGSSITGYTAISNPGNITGTCIGAACSPITVTGLNNGTAYTFTVTATNGVGTGPVSGVSNSVTPAVPWACGDTLIDTRDSKTYTTVQIGSQCWMAQNMNVGTMTALANNQGTDCPSAAAIEKYCYQNDENICTTDGGLYQWNQAMCGSTSVGAQGICPTGWHIPTHDEGTTLERAVCTSGTCTTDFPYDTTTTGLRGTNEGTKLKSGGTSGFNGILAGGRYFNGQAFYWRGVSLDIWFSTFSGSDAWRRELDSGNTKVYRGLFLNTYGISVRCLKD